MVESVEVHDAGSEKVSVDRKARQREGHVHTKMADSTTLTGGDDEADGEEERGEDEDDEEEYDFTSLSFNDADARSFPSTLSFSS